MALQIDMRGKNVLIMGVTNKRSLGWAIASTVLEAGANVAFSYQGERLKEELERLTAEIPDSKIYPCDVTKKKRSRLYLRSWNRTGGRWTVLCTRWPSRRRSR